MASTPEQRRAQQKRYDEKNRERLRGDYLKRKAAGYYKSTCACGAPKTRGAKSCLQCGRASMIATRAAKSLARPFDAKTYYRNYMRAKRAAARAERSDPLCKLGPKQCATRLPHRHCDCGLPISPSVGWCDMCWRELQRGAVMGKQEAA